MRLQEDAVDIVDVDGLADRAYGLDQAADAQVAGLTQHAVGTADDQIDGRLREGVVAQAGPVQFAQDEVTYVIGVEAFANDRVGDPALDGQVDAQAQGGEQAGTADEDEVVVLGEVLKKQP